MSRKRVVRRSRADKDVFDALEYLEATGGRDAARNFLSTFESALNHLADHPASGSLRYAHELDLPGLRFWPLKRSPYLVFYVERESHIEIWRLLHGERDIPASLQIRA